MQYVLSVLSVLACPLGMGVLMWFIVRTGREQNSAHTSEIPTQRQEERAVMPDRSSTTPALVTPTLHSSLLKTLWDCVQMCLNWKVLVGLVAIAVLIGVFASNLFFAALPILLTLICPLSMVIMMVRMGTMSRTRQTLLSEDASCPTNIQDQANQTDSVQPHQAFGQHMPVSERSSVAPRS